MNDRTGIASELDPDLAIEPERYEFFEGPAYHFDLDRRGFLKAMGGGILILSLLDRDADQAEAQPPGGGRQRGGGGRGGQSAPRDIGAWLHIGEDGKIAVYTGKAEVGQNIRTSLSQAVAEELHAPIESIHMVMADTQLTPYDMGTFGSRSTPSMSPQLRRSGGGSRDPHRPRRRDLEGRSCRALGLRRGRRPNQDQGDPTLRHPDQGPKAHEGHHQRGRDHARRELEDRRHLRTQG